MNDQRMVDVGLLEDLRDYMTVDDNETDLAMWYACLNKLLAIISGPGVEPVAHVWFDDAATPHFDLGPPPDDGCDPLYLAAPSAPVAPVQAVPDGWMLVPKEPTDLMREEGAQRLVRFENDSTKWPDSFSPLHRAAARNEAERVWLSMGLAAPQPPKEIGE